MNLNLAIIHINMVVETLELEPGEYTLGRSSENNIVVQHFSLHLRHGRVFFEEGQWFFENLTNGRTIVINNAETIAIGDHISLATKEHVERGKAKISSFAQVQGAHQEKLKKRLVIAAGLVACLLLVTFMGYRLFRTGQYPVNENRLLSKIRTKIVEFEVDRDEKAIADLMSYANLKATDFREASGFCTGFLVGPNIVLTAGHCLLGRMVIDINNNFYLKTSDGKKHQIQKVLGFDVKRDFLFLQMQGMEEYGHLNFASEYQIEQKVYTVGNVHGEGIAIRDGIVSSESADADDPSVKFLRYSAGTSPGNSGGPLVDESGDVVALVFAATNSENFNLGTPAKDLQAAYEQYVNNKEGPQSIRLEMKRVLNFKAPQMLQALSLPYLPQFDHYPEIARKFNDIFIDVEVPIEFSQVDETIIKPLNKKVIKLFNEVQSVLKDKNEIILDWKSFVSDQHPAILPSQFDTSQSTFVKINNRYYPMVAGLIDSPSKPDLTKYHEQFKKENKFDFQSYGYNIRIDDQKIDFLDSDIFYKPENSSGEKSRISDLSFGTPYSQMVVYGREDIRVPGFFGLKLFMKNFIGKKGVLASSVSRFVRPQSMKDFTLREIKISKDDVKVAKVKDRLGRQWWRSRLKLFESVHVVTYCMSMPEATICVGRIFNIYNDYLFKVIENNFRKFILSHLLINPYFWQTDALLSFIESKKAQKLPLMAGVNLKKTGNSLSGSLSLFPLRFEIPKIDQIESVRLQTGLYGNSKKADWTGYGIEWVQREKEKDLVCGIGLEVFKSQSTFILNFLRDRRKQEKLKKIKGEDPKPLPGVWYRPFRGLKIPFQLYGYCAPLEEDPRISGQYFVDFKNSKPLKYNYNIAQ